MVYNIMDRLDALHAVIFKEHTNMIFEEIELYRYVTLVTHMTIKTSIDRAIKTLKRVQLVRENADGLLTFAYTPE